MILVVEGLEIGRRICRHENAVLMRTMSLIALRASRLEQLQTRARRLTRSRRHALEARGSVSILHCPERQLQEVQPLRIRLYTSKKPHPINFCLRVNVRLWQGLVKAVRNGLLRVGSRIGARCSGKTVKLCKRMSLGATSTALLQKCSKRISGWDMGRFTTAPSTFPELRVGSNC